MHLEAGHGAQHQQVEPAREQDAKAHVADVSQHVGLFPSWWLDLRQTADLWELHQILLRWEMYWHMDTDH